MVNEFTKVCDESEILEGTVRVFEANGVRLALARYEGVIYAVDDICTHDGGNLGEGVIVKGQVQCPRHGARFDLKTGNVTRMPAVIPISAYEVRVEDGQVMVAVPE